jgi:predicted SAM-dependent methyltransferase
MRIPFLARWRRDQQLRRLRAEIQAADPLKVVIGSGTTAYSGWIATDRDVLDITEPASWARLFDAESISRILSEHVLEHLTEAECKTALTISHRYLKRGGVFRIAVPDGYRRDAAYLAEASPPKDGHQVLFNVDSLTRLLAGVGFSVTPLEYFDQGEQFQARPWDESEGLIARSVRFDRQQDFRRGDLYYTSLIVDACKP